jgi:hypothetical protein
MFVIRDIMYCKPGQVRPLVDKFKSLSKLMKKKGMGSMRLMTDVCAERYWTVVSEMEVESIEEFAKMSRESMKEKDFQKIMKDYHDYVQNGRREIYMLEK